MAKVSQKKWDQARTLFELGKSYREIEKETGIPFATVSYRQKKEGWCAGKLNELISEKVRVEADILNMEPAQQVIIAQEVAHRLSGMQFYSTEARKVVKKGVESFMADPNPNGMKTTLDGMKSGMQVEGLVPFYQSAQQINNTNAQQNNNEEKRRVFHVVE
jgi:hypothetical protein